MTKMMSLDEETEGDRSRTGADLVNRSKSKEGNHRRVSCEREGEREREIT